MMRSKDEIKSRVYRWVDWLCRDATAEIAEYQGNEAIAWELRRLPPVVDTASAIAARGAAPADAAQATQEIVNAAKCGSHKAWRMAEQRVDEIVRRQREIICEIRGGVSQLLRQGYSLPESLARRATSCPIHADCPRQRRRSLLDWSE
jgi:hypothetical protein